VTRRRWHANEVGQGCVVYEVADDGTYVDVFTWAYDHRGERRKLRRHPSNDNGRTYDASVDLLEK
jgi:hypothetical protein